MSWNYDGCLVEVCEKEIRVYLDEHTPTWVRKWLTDELAICSTNGVYMVLIGYGNDDCTIYQLRCLHKGLLDWQPLYNNPNGENKKEE